MSEIWILVGVALIGVIVILPVINLIMMISRRGDMRQLRDRVDSLESQVSALRRRPPTALPAAGEARTEHAAWVDAPADLPQAGVNAGLAKTLAAVMADAEAPISPTPAAPARWSAAMSPLSPPPFRSAVPATAPPPAIPTASVSSPPPLPPRPMAQPAPLPSAVPTPPPPAAAQLPPHLPAWVKQPQTTPIHPTVAAPGIAPSPARAPLLATPPEFAVHASVAAPAVTTLLTAGPTTAPLTPAAMSLTPPPFVAPTQPGPAATSSVVSSPVVSVTPPPLRPAVPRPPEPPPPPPVPAKSLEEWISTLLLPAGIVTLLICVVLSLGFAFNHMGAAGKLALGALTACAAGGIGLAFEHREKYRLLGRALLALGWGIAYFVAFSTHFVEAARIFDAPGPAILLMLGVGAAAVLFSLRYDHEWTSTAALLMIFLGLGIAVKHVEVSYNLIATVLAAITTAVLGRWKRWSGLLACCVPVAWLILALWLVPRVFAADAGPAGIPGALPALIAAWLAFEVALGLWPEKELQAAGPIRSGHSAAWLVNFLFGAGLVIGHLVWLDSPLKWVAALAFGIFYVALGAWHARRGARGHYLVAVTAGLLLLAMVTPLRLGLGSEWVPLYRMFGLAALLSAGVFLRERWFRTLATAGFVFATIEIFARWLGEHPVLVSGHTISFRLVLLGGCAFFTLLARLLFATAWEEALEAAELRVLPALYTALGALTLAWAILTEAPAPWLAPLFAGCALLWAIAACKGALDLFIAGGAYGIVGALYALTRNFTPDPGQPIFRERTLPVLLTAAALAVIYEFAQRARARAPNAANSLRIFSLIHCALATLLLVPLVAVEMKGGGIAPIAALTALLLVFAANKERPELWISAQAFAGLTVWGLFSDSLPLSGNWWNLPARPLSVGVAAALLYGAHARARTENRKAPWPVQLAAVLQISLAALAIGLTLERELAFASLAPVYALFALGFAFWALRRKLPEFQAQAAGFALAATVFAFLRNLDGPPPFMLRALPVLIIVLLFMAVYLLAERSRAQAPASPRLLAVLHSGLASLLLIALITIELEHGGIAPVCALGGLLLLFAGRERRPELWVYAQGFAGAALWGIFTDSLPLETQWFGFPARLLSAGAAIALIYLAHARARKDGNEFPGWVKAGAAAQTCLAALGGGWIIHRQFSTGALAPLMALCALGLAFYGLRRRKPELLAQTCGFFVVSLVDLGVYSWSLQGDWLGLPGRLASVLLTLAVFYAIYAVLRKNAALPGNKSASLAAAAGMVLACAAVTGAWLLHDEFAARQWTAWVIAGWGALAIAHLEMAGWKKLRSAWAIAQALFFAAWGNALFVNLSAEPMARTGPILILLAAFAWNWRRGAALAGEWAGEAEVILRPLLQYGGALLAAGLLWRELPAPLVCAGLTGVALVPLALAKWRRDKADGDHWGIAALLLALAGAARGLLWNLIRPVPGSGEGDLLGAAWDTGFASFALPAAIATLLLGYLFIRRDELREKRAWKWLGIEGVRMGWLLPFMGLLLLHLWKEASGTELTIWLVGAGALWIALGFLLRERTLRMSALGLFCFGILKLFFYDLRGLTGLSRIASFGVMGIALIVVNWAYLRFERQLKGDE